MFFHFLLLLTHAELDEQWILPRIDINPLIQKDTNALKFHESMSQVQQAAAEVGFFSIINHGVSQQLINEIHNAAIRFFEEPQGTKMRFSPQEWNPRSRTRFRGYWPKDVFGKECLELSNPSWTTPQTNLACHETNDLELLVNVFGSEWLSTVDRWYNTMLGLGQILLNAMTNSTSVPLEADTSISALRFNHYPERDLNEEPRHFGRDGEPLALEEHVDNVILTILSQDDVEGLQLLGMDNVWHSVPCEPGTLIINTGLALSVITGGRYNATNHRVKWNKSRRISVPFFVEPSAHFPLVPLSLTSEEKADADGYWRWILRELSTKGEYGNRAGVFLAEMDEPNTQHLEL